MTRRKADKALRRGVTAITQRHLEAAKVVHDAVPAIPFKRYEPLPGVIPPDKETACFAMDFTPYEVMNALYTGTEYGGFLGYPALAAMSQQVEYANMHNVFADEMTRNWIEVKSRQQSDYDPAINKMERALEKFDVKRLLHEAVRQDAMFGVAHIYIDVGADAVENSKPLFFDPRKITRGALQGFRCVDPNWIYPALYNTNQPLRADFYQPQAWFVMGETVHHSRFVSIVSRPVPDILKPSYNFGGLSLTQLMEDCVADWRAAKKNIIKILGTLRMRALKTDMDARLQEPGQFDKRLQLFTKYQDNLGIWALDHSEDLLHMQTSLSELSSLLSNYQEQLCIPSRTTNLKMFGNAPAGLNASGQAEIDTWHETVSGYQDGEMRRLLENIFKLIQLSEFGAINDDIYFDFRPLDEISEKERAEIAKIRVDTVAVAADSQLISSEEGREALKGVENAGFEWLEGVDYEPEENEALESDSLQRGKPS